MFRFKKYKMALCAFLFISTLALTSCGKTDSTQVPETTSPSSVETSDNPEETSPVDERFYELKVTIPESLQSFVSIDTTPFVFSENNPYNVISIDFASGEDFTQLGYFAIYKKDLYESLKSDGSPVETELFHDDSLDIVVAFSGLQDLIFPEGSPSRELVQKYQALENEIKKSASLTEVVSEAQASDSSN